MNDMSSPVFDPEVFMNQTVDQPFETEQTLCPEGDYLAMIDDFDAKAFRTNNFVYKKGPNAGLPGSMTNFDCPWVIQDEAVKASLGLTKVLVYSQHVLDFVPGTIQLDFGPNKNLFLGRVRDAVGQNGKGPWAPQHLRGQGPCMVRVIHREYERKDGTKGKQAIVERVVRIS